MAAVCLALATALVLSVEGPFWATMTEIAGPRSGAAGGVMNMGSNLGGLVSPALTPVLAAAIGWENALHVAAALSVVGGLLWLGVSPPAGETDPGLLQGQFCVLRENQADLFPSFPSPNREPSR